MTAWYRDGTVTVTQGSATIEGQFSAWLSRVRDGDLFWGPDGEPYEVTAIASNTSLTINPAYRNLTQSGASYAVMRGLEWSSTASLAVQVSEIVNSSVDILGGNGAPAASLGTTGSRYFDDQNLNYYSKATGVWVLVASLVGPPGTPGTPGTPGNNGAAATVTVGVTTTGAAGTNASVTNTGTSSAAVFNFTVPRGDTGASGAQGIQGPTGSAATIAVGTVTTLSPGAPATVANSGSSSAAVLDFGVPVGPANSLSVGTVTTGAAGSSVVATITGTAPTQTLNLTIPRGDTGASGSGTGDIVGPVSVVADNLSAWNGTTGDILKDAGVAIADVSWQKPALHTRGGAKSITTPRNVFLGKDVMVDFNRQEMAAWYRAIQTHHTTGAPSQLVITIIGDSTPSSYSGTITMDIAIENVARRRGFKNINAVLSNTGGVNNSYIETTQIPAALTSAPANLASLFILRAGINDELSGSPLTLAQSETAVRAQIARLRDTGASPAGKNAGTASILLMAPTIADNPGSPYFQSKELAQELNTMYREVAHDLNVAFYDGYAYFTRAHADANWMDAVPGPVHNSDIFQAAVAQGVADMLFPEALGELYGNPVTTDHLPVFNLFEDAGRFGGTPEPSGVTGYLASTYTAPNYMAVANSAVFSNGGKYTFNTSTYGGAAAALNADVQALIEKIKAGGSTTVKQFGPEFYLLGVTSGTGTAASTIVNGTTRYLTNTTSAVPIAPVRTVNFYVRCLTGSLHIPNLTLKEFYYDGLYSPLGREILPADNWVQVTLITKNTALDFFEYDNSLFPIYSTVSATWVFALPMLYPGMRRPTLGQMFGRVPSLRGFR